ncbi:MAG: type I-F CRISPR-associated protein Csy2 [Legionella sp.]|nr:MAG: type I-F CRISPR-associated protein Csy2 [Legionella sp.]PJD98431.1 MAG: type I-F CRISPR-associated protein Csy2 [Legionella sp.]
MSIKKILLLPHINIHNANALSSPFTIGFPAMTAWLGATHALQRKLKEKGVQIHCKATGVVSHQFDLQTYRGKNAFVSSIIGTANPLDQFGKRPSFIEEPRCHLNVSLLIEIEGVIQEQHHILEQTISDILHAKLKIAGGDIRTFSPPTIIVIDEHNAAELRAFKRKLMPGYVLIERRDLMIAAMDKGQDPIDAIIDYLAIHHYCNLNDSNDVIWTRQRKKQNNKPAGWIVPIATGFHGLTDIGLALNQRDPSTPHRFVESLVTLGEFKMPHRFSNLTQMLWHYQFDAENQLYQCIQTHTTNIQQDDFI